jgi:hypothetical protein
MRIGFSYHKSSLIRKAEVVLILHFHVLVVLPAGLLFQYSFSIGCPTSVNKVRSLVNTE